MTAGFVAADRLDSAQQPGAVAPAKPSGTTREYAAPFAVAPQAVNPLDRRSAVALIHGQDRRKNVYEALVAVDDQIRPALKRKKYVVIKPNDVTTSNALGATNADALRGILDYLDSRFRGSIVIAESSAGNTMDAYENFSYARLAPEYRRQKISLVDLNVEGKYEKMPLLDENMHVVPVRLAARLLDPDAFIICSAILKTHDTVVATLSVKNMTLGAPLHNAPKETPLWNDKRRYHIGVRQSHYNMFLTAQKMRPFWGVTVIDGFEGMEGNGPARGTPVPSRIAIASTDYVAADRTGVEAMGINPDYLGYLRYCGFCGVGNYDLAKIDLRGNAKIEAVRRTYRLHNDVDRQLRWLGPMEEIPPKVG